MNGEESYALSRALTAEVAAGIKNYSISDTGLLTMETANGKILKYQFKQPLDGKDGVDGISVTSITINSSNHIIVTFSDGSNVDAGEIQVEEGNTGHTIQDKNGESLTQRANLRFMNSTVIDDVESNSTLVIPEGSGGSKSAAIPVGTIIPFIGTTAPNNFLVCDGKTYNISEYDALANFINTVYGTYYYFGGSPIYELSEDTEVDISKTYYDYDSETGSYTEITPVGTENPTSESWYEITSIGTFGVPNLTNRFLKGNDSASVGDFESAGLPDIQGNLANISYFEITNRNGAFTESKHNRTYPWAGGNTFNSVSIDFKASNSNSIYGNSDTVTPANMSVLYCICYQSISEYINDIKTQVDEVKTKVDDGHVYSTEEQVVGKWIDGKTIYETTFDISEPVTSYNNVRYIQYTAKSGIDDVISQKGYFILNNSKKAFGTTEVNWEGNCSCHSYAQVSSDGNLIIYILYRASNYSSNPITGKVTIQYTKTTG